MTETEILFKTTTILIKHLVNHKGCSTMGNDLERP